MTKDLKPPASNQPEPNPLGQWAIALSVVLLAGLAYWWLLTEPVPPPAQPLHVSGESPAPSRIALPPVDVAQSTPGSTRTSPPTSAEAPAFWPAGSLESGAWTGRLTRPLPNLAILTVRGTPLERGTAHGQLLGLEIRALVAGVNGHLQTTASAGETAQARLAACLDGARVMKKYIEPDVLEELTACAKAAQVDADELLLAQLFGDVNRGKGFATFCSCYAAFGPATADGTLLMGRNFDYAGHGLEKTIPLILQEIPLGPSGQPVGPSFITIGYAGILNGWTAMNADGLCAENNTLFGGENSLEGLATCFMVRKVVERARTVEAGVALIEKTPRACTTAMIVAGKNTAGAWDARLCEFDHAQFFVIEPNEGTILETNTCQKLRNPAAAATPMEPVCSRYQTMKRVLRTETGTLAFGAGAKEAIAKSGVYLSINLHCAILDPARQRIQLAVSGGISREGDGGITTGPAAEKAFHVFQVNAASVTLQPAP